MTTTVDGLDGLRDLVGAPLGSTEPMVVTQERVDLFAEATGDHQWIHVDPERAARESPFGGPIAHGYLTLSLIPALLPQVLVVKGTSRGVNDGCEKVRFPSPVPVGAKLRMTAELVALADVAGGVRLTIRATLATEGAAKPSCVADVVYRYDT